MILFRIGADSAACSKESASLIKTAVCITSSLNWIQSGKIYQGWSALGHSPSMGYFFCYSLNKLVSLIVASEGILNKWVGAYITIFLWSSEASLIPETPKSGQWTLHSPNDCLSQLISTHSSVISQGPNFILPPWLLHAFFPCLLNPFAFYIYIGLPKQPILRYCLVSVRFIH